VEVKPSVLVVLVVLTTACTEKSSGPPLDLGVEEDGVAATGPVVSLLAGAAGGRGAVDGTLSTARLNEVADMVSDGKYLYLLERGNAAVRRLELATGKVTTLAGQPGLFEYPPQDGQGTAASFYNPLSLTLLGADLYVADWDRIRRVDRATGRVTTLTASSTGKVWHPSGRIPFAFHVVAVKGKVYVASLNAIWVYEPAKGTFALFAGDPQDSSRVDGQGTSARFVAISGMATDDLSTLFIGSCVIRTVDIATGRVKTVAGKLEKDLCYQGTSDGVGSGAKFLNIEGISFDGKDLYLVEYNSSDYFQDYGIGFGRVRRYSPATGVVTTLAGVLPGPTATFGDRDGPASFAAFIEPLSVLAAKDGLYIGSPASIRRLSWSDWSATTLAGQRQEGRLLAPAGLALYKEHLYTYSNTRAHLLRVNLKAGTQEVFAIFDKKELPVERSYGFARIGGTLYFAESSAIVALDLSTRKSTTIVDLYKLPSLVVSRGLATDGTYLYHLVRDLAVMPPLYQLSRVDPGSSAGQSAVLYTTDKWLEPRIIHANKSIYMADRGTISRLDLTTKKLAVVAGNGAVPGCGDGVGTAARFIRPMGLASDGAHLFIGDAGCHTIRRLDLTSGKVTTLAGSPLTSTFKPGVGTSAGINSPNYLTYDSSSNILYAADPSENVVFKVTHPLSAGGGG